MFENISAKQLARAAQIKERIEELQQELDALIGSAPSAQTSTTARSSAGRGRGPMTAEGKARIIAAQKARWAKYRKEKGTTAGSTSTRGQSTGQPKRTMSPAAKARIAAAARKRWAAAKAAGRSSL